MKASHDLTLAGILCKNPTQVVLAESVHILQASLDLVGDNVSFHIISFIFNLLWQGLNNTRYQLFAGTDISYETDMVLVTV